MPDNGKPFDQQADPYFPCVFGIDRVDACPRHANVWLHLSDGVIERACYAHSNVARELHEHMVAAIRQIDGVTL